MLYYIDISLMKLSINLSVKCGTEPVVLTIKRLRKI